MMTCVLMEGGGEGGERRQGNGGEGGGGVRVEGKGPSLLVTCKSQGSYLSVVFTKQLQLKLDT